MSTVPTEDAPAAGPFVLFVDPDGNDASDGRTRNTALATLSGAQAKLREYRPTLTEDVEIRITYDPARPYKGQAVSWNHTSPDHTISFMPADYHEGAGIDDIAGRPVFDGQGSPGYLVSVASSAGKPTNVRFYYLQIENYVQGAIQFLANRSNSDRWQGYNVVYGCWLANLGNLHVSSDAPGYGGIDLVNADHNLIQNNHFVGLINKSVNSELLHAIYLAHGSDHNEIISNHFENVSGDPIRVRDASNYNEIRNNVFTRTGTRAFFSDWHDDGECRSWENQFRNNTSLACGYGGASISTFTYIDGNPEASGCTDLAARLHTSGNDPDPCP